MPEEKTEKIRLLSAFPENGAEMELLSVVQRCFLLSEAYRKRRRTQVRFIDGSDPYLRRGDLSFPEPVTLMWKTEPVCGAVLVGMKKDLSDGFRYPGRDLGDGLFRLRLSDLIPGKRYFWAPVQETGDRLNKALYFRTEKGVPRLIRAADLTNVRDVGGTHIPYGIIFRGSGFSGPFHILDEGKYVLEKLLGIRTVLDLTCSESRDETFFTGVRAVPFPMKAYGNWSETGVFSPEQKALTARLFRLFLKKENFPFYIHCAGGSDRTGTVTALLEGLAGFTLHEAEREYEVTSLSAVEERCRNSDAFRSLVLKLREYGGRSFSVQCQRYLSNAGLAPEELAQIRCNLTEKSEPPFRGVLSH